MHLIYVCLGKAEQGREGYKIEHDQATESVEGNNEKKYVCTSILCNSSIHTDYVALYMKLILLTLLL